MARHRSHSVELKRQVAQEYLAGETLNGLARRHDIARNLIRIWAAKYETGSFDSETAAADMVQAQDARIAALERLVGKLALENEFLKGAYQGLPEIEYPLHDRDILVTACGRICMHRKKINVSTVLAGQRLGLKEVDDAIWLVSFMTYDLGYIDLEQKTLQPLDNPFGTRLLPMS